MNPLIGRIDNDQLILDITLVGKSLTLGTIAILDTSLPEDLTIGSHESSGFTDFKISETSLLRNLNGTKPTSTSYSVKVELDGVVNHATAFVIKNGQTRIGNSLLKKFGFTKIEMDYNNFTFTLS